VIVLYLTMDVVKVSKTYTLT